MFREINSVSELDDADNGWVNIVIISAEDRIGTTGKPFIDTLCADGVQTFSAKVWNKTLLETDIIEGNTYSAKIGAKLYRGNMTYELQRWDEAPNIDPRLLLVGPPVSIDTMSQWVDSRINALRPVLHDIATNIMDVYGDLYRLSAAGRSMHHAYVGGLLYHSYRMAFSAEALAKIYDVDADLCVCGALLHDIGKVVELETSWTGRCSYTLRGQLEGHSSIGCDIVRKAARNIGIDENDPDLIALTHIIASHHGSREFGAIIEPMTSEAMLISQLDKIDMEQEIVEQHIHNGANGISSDKNPALDRRIVVL